ncbi:Transcription initiation factor TFIID subunit 5 [Lecanora helva]
MTDSGQQVIEYLSKKGYSKTESMLRIESANQDVEGKQMSTKTEETGGVKYLRAFDFLPKDGRDFFDRYKSKFKNEHEDDVRALEPVSLPEHVQSNAVAKFYRENRYRVTISQVAFYNLVQFLESKQREGGAVIVGVIQSFLNVITLERAADDQYNLARLINRARATEDFPAEDEGIPGHNPGSANVERTAGSTVLTRLKLGPMPMETELMSDVRADLEQEDIKNPPLAGQDSLAQHFEQKIKREESEDAPTRTELQLPPSVARDVAMEVQKVKEDRDRFKIEDRSGGVGPGVSVTMFTFHNTHDSINCLDFSEDNLFVAAGMNESYIRVWSLDGKPLPSNNLDTTGLEPSPSRRLVGHSGPVYAVSFSPSIAITNSHSPSTISRHLLSSSADKSVRLWSLETWTCLVIYKGHDHPVWDVTWGPFGLYFLTGSLDRTSRLWRTDHIEDLRMFVGHDKDVDTVCFHPNSAYVFTGSSDKIVRMWAVANGYPVRMFTGHTGNVTSLACSPSGKLLASADETGTIILWDLGPGKLKKRMRGHGKGGVWSLSWSVESTVLASGGADGTVRIWDVNVPNDANGQGRVPGESGPGQKLDGNAAQMQGVTVAGAKKKGKDVVVTSDQISAFPTKRSPVYKVRFTRQNLVVAGGAYLP